MTSEAPGRARTKRATAPKPSAGSPATPRSAPAASARPSVAGPSASGVASRVGPIQDFTFEPHHCFACGELNEHGLHLELHVDAQGCWTELTLEPRFQGWESVAHGGIVASILDEVMAWSVIGRDTWGVTARLSVAFHRPISIGRPIRAEGWVTEDRRRTFRTAGRILDHETGEILASAEGAFVAAPPDQLAALKARYRLRPAGDRPGRVGAEEPATPEGVASAGLPRS